MSDCNKINCPTCNFELDESFIEQKCPRCQSLIESKFLCGSCNSCADSLSADEIKKESLVKKLFSIFKK